jgi:hypothetical protein
MDAVIADFRLEFERHKKLADRATSTLADDAFFHSPGQVNSAAVVVKHLAGNLASRWTEFLTTTARNRPAIAMRNLF